MSGLPVEHWHAVDSDMHLRRDFRQIGIDNAVIEHTVEKCPFVRRQIEQDGESFATERDGLLNLRVDFSLCGKSIATQTSRELPAELARITLDGVDRFGAPVTPPTGADGQNGGLDSIPVEPVDGEYAPHVEQIACCMPVDERDKLAGGQVLSGQDRQP